MDIDPVAPRRLRMIRNYGVLRGAIFVKILVAFAAGVTLLADPNVIYEVGDQTGPAFPVRLVGSWYVAFGVAMLGVLFARSVSRWIFMLRVQVAVDVLVVVSCIAEKITPSVASSISTATLIFHGAELLVWSFFLAEFTGRGLATW